MSTTPKVALMKVDPEIPEDNTYARNAFRFSVDSEVGAKNMVEVQFSLSIDHSQSKMSTEGLSGRIVHFTHSLKAAPTLRTLFEFFVDFERGPQIMVGVHFT